MRNSRRNTLTVSTINQSLRLSRIFQEFDSYDDAAPRTDDNDQNISTIGKIGRDPVFLYELYSRQQKQATREKQQSEISKAPQTWCTIV